jgi:hypothetical protein
MSIIRSLVTHYKPGALPRDKFTNVVYHSDVEIPVVTSTDWTNHATEVLQAFTGGTDDAYFTYYKDRIVEVRCYDMADSEPRAEKAFVSADLSSGAGPWAPPELAVVLSFFADRNIAGLRSHIFIGPLPVGAISAGGSAERPPDALINNVLTLGAALWNVGGANISHVIRHPKLTKSGHAAGSTNAVTDYSVANAWGAVHSRNLRPTMRATHHP